MALFLFCVIGIGAYLAMEISAGFRPEKSEAFLTRLPTWLNTHTDQLIIIVSLVLGFWLIGRASN